MQDKDKEIISNEEDFIKLKDLMNQIAPNNINYRSGVMYTRLPSSNYFLSQLEPLDYYVLHMISNKLKRDKDKINSFIVEFNHNDANKIGLSSYKKSIRNLKRSFIIETYNKSSFMVNPLIVSVPLNVEMKFKLGIISEAEYLSKSKYKK